MIKCLTAIYFVLLSVKTFCKGSCPLDDVQNSQNITQLSGRWYEYKKTIDYLAGNVCTTYDVTCSNDTACNINLLPNGTNTGVTNTLLVTNGTTMWNKNDIYLNVDLDKQYAIFWNCKGEEQNKEYELAVLMKNISDENTVNDIDILLENITIKFEYQLETINNSLCNGAKQETMHLIALVIILFSILIKISNL